MKFRPPIFHARMPRSQRLLASLSLVGYLAATIGFPMPAPASKPGEKPFPCQQHACGCVSSAQCWADCCCFTPREKLAWARQHQVDPPAELIAAVTASEQAEHDHADHDQVGHDHAGHDHHRGAAATSAKSCCQKHAATDVQACHADGPQDSSQAAPAEAPRGTFWIGALARRCRGLPTSWISVESTLGPPRISVQLFAPECVEWLSPRQPRCATLDPAPPIPPPRLV